MLFTGRREREELQTRNQALELRQQELEEALVQARAEAEQLRTQLAGHEFHQTRRQAYHGGLAHSLDSVEVIRQSFASLPTSSMKTSRLPAMPPRCWTTPSRRSPD